MKKYGGSRSYDGGSGTVGLFEAAGRGEPGRKSKGSYGAETATGLQENPAKNRAQGLNEGGFSLIGIRLDGLCGAALFPGPAGAAPARRGRSPLGGIGAR